MPFTVDEFHDLLHLLEAHPEWRAELRRHVLSEELLELPALLRQIAERVDALAEAQARTERQLEELAQRIAFLTGSIDELAGTVHRMTGRVDRLAGETWSLPGDGVKTGRRRISLSRSRWPSISMTWSGPCVRAGLLGRLGHAAMAVVAGESIDARAATLAHEHNVWQVLDGAAQPPVIW